MADRLTVVIAVCAFDPDSPDPDALLDRYNAPNGWADAVKEAGADAVTVVYRFRRPAKIRRGQVDYHFIVDGEAPSPPRRYWGSRIAKAVERLAPTVVHLDGLVFPLLVRSLRMRLRNRAAIVVQDHGGLEAQASGFWNWQRRALYRFGLGGADAFLFTAREQAAPYLRAGVISSPDAVHGLLESSTDMASWPTGPGATSRLPGRPALLWVGRLDANKDPLTVLDGFERASAALPDAALTLVYGDDVMLPEVKARIDRSPVLRARVHLRGKLPQAALPAFYAAADLFVLGSHREVACFSLIEALSFGVTPVVTDIPPFRAITEGGRIGALFPPRDAAALARALAEIGQSDLQTRRTLVREHFARELSWPVVGARALAVYRAVAQARRLLAAA